MSVFSRSLLLIALLGLAGCKNQEPDSPSNSTPPPVPPAIAPGHVALTGTLSDCSEAARAMHCTLTVISVQEYGAGTMQLPAGTQMLVSARQAVLSDYQAAAEMDPIGRELHMTIVAERPAPDDPEQPAWRVSQIDQP